MKNASRLYVNLVHGISARFGVWEPDSTTIEVKCSSCRLNLILTLFTESSLFVLQVGDYGTVNSDTGIFERKGNIRNIQGFEALVPYDYPETTGSITITTGKTTEFNIGASVGLQPDLQFQVCETVRSCSQGMSLTVYLSQVEYDFGKNSAAVLHASNLQTVRPRSSWAAEYSLRLGLFSHRFLRKWTSANSFIVKNSRTCRWSQRSQNAHRSHSTLGSKVPFASRPHLACHTKDCFRFQQNKACTRSTAWLSTSRCQCTE